ncbi:MAG: ABC transporter ATP-binding protein [Candidatus Bathyarchaeota archaeon]
MTRVLEAKNIAKYHETINGRHFPTLEKISFDVKKKEFLCVVGPSGCGKSTLLKILAGLEKPSHGEVRLYGEPIKSPHPKISMVFQNFALFPWRTVIQNIEFGLEMQGMPKPMRRKIAEEFVNLMGLKGYENAYPKDLSGGMKQRVAIARALAVDPDVVLMDEAFSAIDEYTAQVLRSEVLELWEGCEKSFILVTHNLAEALEMGDRIIVLTRKPAKVKHVYPVNLKRPRTRSHSKFLKCLKELFTLLEGELEHVVVKHKLRSIYEHHKIDDMENY